MKTPKTVAELYELHETIAAEAKALYDRKDTILKKLVRAWKKNKTAIALSEKNKITGAITQYVLEIEDRFRGQTKAFAPGFAHRYNLKLRTVQDSE